MQEPEGLLVLSEVALGEMYEKNESEFIKTLPPGKDSTKGSMAAAAAAAVILG